VAINAFEFEKRDGERVNRKEILFFSQIFGPPATALHGNDQRIYNFYIRISVTREGRGERERGRRVNYIN
jgi:hypothetical protein